MTNLSAIRSGKSRTAAVVCETPAREPCAAALCSAARRAAAIRAAANSLCRCGFADLIEANVSRWSDAVITAQLAAAPVHVDVRMAAAAATAAYGCRAIGSLLADRRWLRCGAPIRSG